MSFEEIFQPGLRHWREQREFQKVKVNQAASPGPGPADYDPETDTVYLDDQTTRDSGEECPEPPER